MTHDVGYRSHKKKRRTWKFTRHSQYETQLPPDVVPIDFDRERMQTPKARGKLHASNPPPLKTRKQRIKAAPKCLQHLIRGTVWKRLPQLGDATSLHIFTGNGTKRNGAWAIYESQQFPMLMTNFSTGKESLLRIHLAATYGALSVIYLAMAEYVEVPPYYLHFKQTAYAKKIRQCLEGRVHPLDCNYDILTEIKKLLDHMSHPQITGAQAHIHKDPFLATAKHASARNDNTPRGIPPLSFIGVGKHIPKPVNFRIYQRKCAFTTEIRKQLRTAYKWSEDTIDLIDWNAFEQAFKKLPQHRATRTTKLTHDWLPTRTHLQDIDNTVDGRCPLFSKLWAVSYPHLPVHATKATPVFPLLPDPTPDT